MTVSALSSESIFLGNGITSTWTFPWVGVSASFINVYFVDTDGSQTLLNTSAYSITLNPAGAGQLWGVGGTITYPLAGMPIADGTMVIVQRAVPYSQNTNVANQTAYPLSVQAALDTLCFEIQQIVSRTGQLRGTWATSVQYNFGDVIVDGVNGANSNNLYMCTIANLSGTWSTDLANGDWALALNVQSIINSLPILNNNEVFGNIVGTPATPIGVSATALLDSAFGNVQGNILYRNAANWVVLAPGSAGQLLRTGGAAANVSWASAGAGTITEVDAGTGLSGGGTSGIVALALAAIGDNTLLANTTGSSNPPSATTLSALIDEAIGNAQGSLLYRNSGGWVTLPAGTTGQTLQTNGAGANPSWVSNTFAPQGFIAGCLPSSITGTHTSATMTVSSGQATNTTNATILSSAGYSWAATNGNAINGTDAASSTLANSATYHMYLISGGSGTGVFASATYPAGSVSFPAGYNTYARRIFSFTTTGAGAPIPYTAIEAEGGALLAWLTTQILDINVNNQGASRILYPLTVPTGLKMAPIGRMSGPSTSGHYVIFTSGDETDVAPALSNSAGIFTAAPGADTSNPGSGGDAGALQGTFLTTDTSAQIGVKGNTTNITVAWVTRGFKDFRRS